MYIVFLFNFLLVFQNKLGFFSIPSLWRQTFQDFPSTQGLKNQTKMAKKMPILTKNEMI